MASINKIYNTSCSLRWNLLWMNEAYFVLIYYLKFQYKNLYRLFFYQNYLLHTLASGISSKITSLNDSSDFHIFFLKFFFKKSQVTGFFLSSNIVPGLSVRNHSWESVFRVFSCKFRES